MLRKCIGDPSHFTLIEDVQVTRDIMFEEVPINILERQVRKLWNKEVSYVKCMIDEPTSRRNYIGIEVYSSLLHQ